MQKRSRDYLEIQKKTHQILTAPEGLHYTMYVDHKQQHSAKVLGRQNQM